jgi:hypothetical protein
VNEVFTLTGALTYENGRRPGMPYDNEGDPLIDSNTNVFDAAASKLSCRVMRRHRAHAREGAPKSAVKF